MPGIGAGVLEDLQPQRLDLAVAVAADLEVDPLRAALVHRHQVLAARLGPAHGPAGGPRQPAEDHVLDGEALAAEAAADVGSDHPHLLGLEPQRHRQDHLVLVRRLGRQPARSAGRPRRTAATVARGSIGQAASRGLSTVPETTTSQSSKKLPGRDSPAGWWKQMLVPTSSNSSTSSRAASRGSVTTGSASYSTSTSSAASNAASRVSAEHDGDDVADEAHPLRGQERPEHAARRPR